MSEKCAQKNKLTNGFMHFLTHKQSVLTKVNVSVNYNNKKDLLLLVFIAFSAVC